MNEVNESRYHTGDTLCDALRFLSDASYDTCRAMATNRGV